MQFVLRTYYLQSYRENQMNNLFFMRLGLYMCATMLAFCFGRYTATFKKEVVLQKQEVKVITKRVVVRVKSPDGTVRTVDTTDTVLNSNTLNERKTIIDDKKINISALAGVDLNNRFIPTYGVSATKQIFGPISVGAFGLTNGVVGLSLGVNF